MAHENGHMTINEDELQEFLISLPLKLRPKFHLLMDNWKEAKIKGPVEVARLLREIALFRDFTNTIRSGHHKTLEDVFWAAGEVLKEGDRIRAMKPEEVLPEVRK